MAKTLAERLGDSDVADILTDLDSCSELLDSCETDAGRVGALTAMRIIAVALGTSIHNVIDDHANE